MKRILGNTLIAALSCLFLIGISSIPSFSFSTTKAAPAASPFQPSQPVLEQRSIDRHLMSALDEVDAIVAQGMPAGSMTRYVAVLTKTNVVPATPSTAAFGAAGAVLVGDRLIVRGDYSNLTSALRDYATDPLDPPNPNITSGIHIHQGDPTVNGPFQYALAVEPNADQLSGRFAGEYTLTSEQLEQLANGSLYVDIHTRRNRAGELRGIFQPY